MRDMKYVPEFSGKEEDFAEYRIKFELYARMMDVYNVMTDLNAALDATLTDPIVVSKRKACYQVYQAAATVLVSITGNEVSLKTVKTAFKDFWTAQKDRKEERPGTKKLSMPWHRPQLSEHHLQENATTVDKLATSQETAPTPR
jgi:hypothetical protein